MMTPNNRARVCASAGLDVFGQPRFGAPRSVPCAVVSLSGETTRTGVRTDSSATRGAGEEESAQARILFRPQTVAKGNRVEIAGLRLRIVGLEPRYDVAGRHDHDDCTLSIWPAGQP